MYHPSANDIYHTLPTSFQQVVKRGYHLLHPNRKRVKYIENKRATVKEEFIRQFFNDAAEFEAFESDFTESGVPDVCREHAQSLPHEVSIFDIHKEECVRIYCLLRKLEPKVVVETGVYNGVLTLGVLAALNDNTTGELYAIDNSKTSTGSVEWNNSPAEEGSTRLPEGKEPGWIIPREFEERWTLRQGEMKSELRDLLSDVSRVNVFIHNSRPQASRMLYEFELVWEYLESEGIILSPHAGNNNTFDMFLNAHRATTGDIMWRASPGRPIQTRYVQKH